MSLDGDYEDDNIFARIIRGDIPSAKIFETDRVLAIMDAFPQARGHCLVVHKTARARNLLDAEPQVLHDLIDAVQKLARGVRTALKPDGLVVTQFNGAAAGQTVYHLHFHIIPRWQGEAPRRHGADVADAAQLQQLAQQIAGAL